MPTIAETSVGQQLEERSYSPGNVSLFMYNAAIWNPHRIHYDEPYTTNVEKHPGVVIDGPLQGDWLAQAATSWLGSSGQLVSFEYSNRRAAYLGETLTCGGEVTAVDPDGRTVTLKLAVKNEAGEVTSPGEAVVRLFS
ncbi:MAG: hypothetical protein AAF458_02215 [Pseudomonadota bacterium]